MSEYKTDIDIAREVTGEHINDIGAKLDIDQKDLVPFGHDKAKISWEAIEGAQNNKDGKLILVTAVTPTPAGEGKTTTSVGLTDGLNKIGNDSVSPGAKPRSMFWYERRRSRRWPRTSYTDGRY
jgi:formate--tetrahydrofolate ligase